MAKPFKTAAKKPLDTAKLVALAARQVSRFSITPMGLADYLKRKIRQSAWAEETSPDAAISTIVERYQELGLVSDHIVATQTVAADSRKGLGLGRTRQRLAQRRVAAAAADEAVADAPLSKLALALAFARRRRLGPFREPHDESSERMQKDVAMMQRAGHSPSIAMRIIRASSVAELEEEAASEY